MTYNQNDPQSGLGVILSEKEIITLVNSGTIQVLSEGETLLKRTQRSRGNCLILSGSFKAVGRAGDGTGLTYAKGDFIYEDAVFDCDPCLTAIVAREPSRALVLSRSEFNALNPRQHSTIMRHVAAVQHSKLMDMRNALTSVTIQRDSVTGYCLASARRHRKEYESSEPIQGLIKKIPRLPVHVAQLAEMLLSEKISTKKVTELAKQDPSLVGEVLKEVNSPYYGIRQKVSDLYYAIMLIGFNEVFRILVSQGLRKTMPDTETFREVHQHSIVISYLAFEICQAGDKRDASILSTIGLLHDLGKSTVLLIERDNPKLGFFIQMLDPCKIASMLLSRWNIPGVICETIEYQSYARFTPPPEVPTNYRKYVGILHLAHAIHDAVRGTFEESGYPFLSEYMEICNLNDKDLAHIQGSVMRNLRAKAQLLPMEMRKFILAGD